MMSISKILKWNIFFISILSMAFLSSCNGGENKSGENAESVDSTSNSIVENEEVQLQVGYLKFDSTEYSLLSPGLQGLYLSIVQNTNYASGVSVGSIMEQVNENLNRLMESDTGVIYEKELISAMIQMKGNQRMAAQNFNMAGRWLLRKFYEFQTAKYPSLSAQVSALKVNLGDVNSNDRLIGQEKKVRAYIDQCFVILYLMEEKEAEMGEREE